LTLKDVVTIHPSGHRSTSVEPNWPIVDVERDPWSRRIVQILEQTRCSCGGEVVALERRHMRQPIVCVECGGQFCDWDLIPICDSKVEA
jgi:hypothetical protein